MLRVAILCIILFTTIGGIFLITADRPVSANGMPTPEFIAAALRHQEFSCGQSLEVLYEQEITKRDGSISKSSCRYVRTPEALLRERKREDYAGKESIDRANGEWRYLYTVSGRTTGEIRSIPGGQFCDTQCIDPQLYYLGRPGQLANAVKLGEIAETKEQVDGHECWRIEVRASDRKHVIWVDPNIGFCPRRVEGIMTGSGDAYSSASFHDYKAVGDGVWFPMRQTIESPWKGWPDGKLTTINIVREVNLGTSYPKQELIVSFPSGTRVLVGDDFEYFEP